MIENDERVQSLRMKAKVIQKPGIDTDIQGVEWGIGGIPPREQYRKILDQRLMRMYCVIDKQPVYNMSSLNIPDRYIRVKEYVKKSDIENYHFQLHDNFRAVSPYDFVYSAREKGLIHLNTQTMETHTLLNKFGITCIDTHKNFILIGHEGSEISLVDLETARLLRCTKFHENNENQLINCIRFLDDRSGGLKTIIAGNKHNVEIYDFERSTTPMRSIPVDFFVNSITLSRDNTQMGIAYDDTQVDVFDLRTSKKSNEFKGHQDYTFSVDFDCSGNYLASGNQDCSTRIWDLRKNQAAAVLPTKSFASANVKFIQNSKYLVAGENYNYVTCYNAHQGYTTSTVLDYMGELVGIGYNKDEREMYVGVGSKVQGIESGIIKADIGAKVNLI